MKSRAQNRELEFSLSANAGDPADSKPVIYTLDFKRIAAKTAFWAGRPAMRIVQALSWFRDDRSSVMAAVHGIVRHLGKSPQRPEIVEDLRENIQALPAWMYPVVNTIIAGLPAVDERPELNTDGDMKENHASDFH